MKIVINSDFGGFGLSNEAIREYGRAKGMNLVEDGPDEYGFIHFYKDVIGEDSYFTEREIDRSDPALVSVVETMGEASFGKYANLKIVEIPDDVKWYVQEYDGREHIAEEASNMAIIAVIVLTIVPCCCRM